MSTVPAASIVMTVHNRREFVEQAVRSVLTQTFKDFEFIIVDDGSTDGAADLLATLAKGDERIRLFLRPHRGLTPALIDANELARGRYIGWVDGDDILIKNALQRTRDHLEANPETMMVYTDHVHIDAHNRLIGRGRHSLPYSKDNLLLEYMTLPFRLFRREALTLSGGIDPTLSRAPDYDFCLRVSEIGRIDHIPEALYCYRMHGKNVSHTHRLDQIESSEQAVRRALARRGLAEKYDLAVTIHSSFQLIPKSASKPA